MKKGEYFKTLVSLYEHQKLTEEEYDEEQAQLADAGTDALTQDEAGLGIAPPADDAGIETAQADPNAVLQDSEYLNQDAGIPGVPNAMGVAPDVSESQRLVKLFGLYKKLLEYTETFYDSLENIDIDLLDEKESTQITKNREKLFSLMEKQKSYMTDVFPKEGKYEKSLYVYVLMRTELAAIIESVRANIGLDRKEEGPTDETGENLKK
jgi:hypothetical protein